MFWNFFKWSCPSHSDFFFFFFLNGPFDFSCRLFFFFFWKIIIFFKRTCLVSETAQRINRCVMIRKWWASLHHRSRLVFIFILQRFFKRITMWLRPARARALLLLFFILLLLFIYFFFVGRMDLWEKQKWKRGVKRHPISGPSGLRAPTVRGTPRPQIK